MLRVADERYRFWVCLVRRHCPFAGYLSFGDLGKTVGPGLSQLVDHAVCVGWRLAVDMDRADAQIRAASQPK